MSVMFKTAHSAALCGLAALLKQAHHPIAQAVDRLVRQAQVDAVMDEAHECAHVLVVRLGGQGGVVEPVEVLRQLGRVDGLSETGMECRIAIGLRQRESLRVHVSGLCLGLGGAFGADEFWPDHMPVVGPQVPQKRIWVGLVELLRQRGAGRLQTSGDLVDVLLVNVELLRDLPAPFGGVSRDGHASM